ncbi:MAG: tetratricopeptide repeat protein [Bacteroidetes bacterium]|nr:tetratricopeptide repeat protein [Bacteroidota bacterium]
MSRNFLLLLLLIGPIGTGFAQKRLIDSLGSLLKRHTKEDSVRVSLLVHLATAEMYDHPATAGNYAAQALSISEKIKYGEGLALSYRLIGNAFWAQANQTAALDNFLKGMKIADSINSEQVQADLMGNLGMVYNDMSDYTSALKYYKASLTKQIELKNKLREAVMRLNMGNGYYRLKKADSSLFYYNQSLVMLHQLKDTRTIIDLANIGIGDVYADLGKYDDALQFYYKGKHSSDTTKHHRAMVHSRMSIAKVRMARNQFTAAEKELLECLKFAQEVRLKTYIRDCYELLYKSAQAQGHTRQSFDYFKSYNSCKDSIQNSSEVSRIASLQLEYEMQKKKLEIDVLKKESQIQTEEIKLKNSLLIMSAIVLLFIAAFLFFTFRGFQIQKSLSIQLADRNKEINRQRTELEGQRDKVITLNKEIRAQQNEAILQRDSLAKKNQSIETLNFQVTETNQILEELVTKRTAVLQEQLKRLEEYAYINAFKLRGPVANIIGIVSLLKKENLEEEEAKMVGYLKKSSDELDRVIRSISETLQHGITAYEKQNSENGNK